jgi:hypothetical protein
MAARTSVTSDAVWPATPTLNASTVTTSAGTYLHDIRVAITLRGSARAARPTADPLSTAPFALTPCRARRDIPPQPGLAA